MSIRELAEQAGIDQYEFGHMYLTKSELDKFAELVAAHTREAFEKVVGDFAKKWWSIHCATNKHMETTRRAHDDFCALQAAIRARGKA